MASPPRTLEGKVAIITGASRGIGAIIALTLASRGARVALTYTSATSRPAIEALQRRMPTPSIAIQADLLHPTSATKIVAETVAAFGGLDILVNNAGSLLAKPLQDISCADFDRVFHLNVRAALLMLQAALPHLRRPGRVVNLSSVGARAHFAGLSAYAASKAALEGFTRGWAMELGVDGTTVNCVAPGPVESEMLDEVPRDIVQAQKDETCVERRVGRAEEVAEIVAFLAEDRSSWVSGQTISASGGYATY